MGSNFTTEFGHRDPVDGMARDRFLCTCKEWYS